VLSKKRDKLQMFYTDLKKGRVEQNAENIDDPAHSVSSDSEFCDNDYEVELGDANLLDENLDEVVGKSDKKAKGTKLKSTRVERNLGGSDDSDEST
jgi:dTDP-glucose pyrophosphorylase